MSKPLLTVLTFIAGAVCGVGATYLALPHTAASQVPPTAAAPKEVARPAAPGDTRISFAVTQAERTHIQGQMLTFLTDLQTLNMAVADEDRDLIREIGTAQANRRDPNGIGQTLRMKAPAGFRQINQSLRGDFAALAEAADTAPVGELQERLSLVMSKCVACHGTYTVSLAEPE